MIHSIVSPGDFFVHSQQRGLQVDASYSTNTDRLISVNDLNCGDYLQATILKKKIRINHC